MIRVETFPLYLLVLQIVVHLGELVVQDNVVGIQEPEDCEQGFRRGIEEFLLVEVGRDEGGVKGGPGDVVQEGDKVLLSARLLLTDPVGYEAEDELIGKVPRLGKKLLKHLRGRGR